ncbi:MAG: acetyl-CoA C-acetyltransferase [Planctomycetota bacterium]
MARRVAVVAALRTPIGKFLGAFAEMSAADLGASVVKATLAAAGLRGDQVDEVILGNARQAGGGPNPARQVSWRAGCPETVPAYTVNKACGSGLKSIVLATQAILLGDAEVVVAGGMESMSRVPYMLPRARTGYRLGHAELVDGMYQDGFLCPLCKDLMGKTAENLADEYRIPREDQDAYAVRSQNRAESAIKSGWFASEIAPVEVADAKGKTTSVAQDEHVRLGATIDGMKKLPAVFKEGGTVTAGNSSGITDGAAALVLMSEEKARALGKEPLGFVEGYVSAGVGPRVMGLGPVPAVRKLNQKLGLSAASYDLVELNEAFAAQVIACNKELGFDLERTNVAGSGISLGHPIGATGARIVVTLLHGMKRTGARRGLATLCISGGQGMAVSITRA